jgi:hypothetical protein
MFMVQETITKIANAFGWHTVAYGDTWIDFNKADMSVSVRYVISSDPETGESTYIERVIYASTYAEGSTVETFTDETVEQAFALAAYWLVNA